MREIKFRAWHKKLKIMKEIFAINMTVPCYSVGVHLEEPTWFEDDIEVMQYTGLKDKNGKEIFDGDILNTGTDDEGSPFLDSVCFEDGAFYLGEKFHNRELLSELNDYSFIVGNIYENPELITAGDGKL